MLPIHIVLRITRNADGSVDRSEARLVAGGSSQVYKQDYMDAYLSVVSSSYGVFYISLFC